MVLNFYPSAKAAYMGNAFSATGDTVETIYYNPAGLSCLNTRQLYASYSYWIFDMYDASLAFVYPVSIHRIAFGIRYFYLGEITETLIDQSMHSKVTLYNTVAILSYSIDLDILKLGISFKNLLQNYGTNYSNISSLVFDLAGRVEVRGISFALNIANLGSSMKIDGIENSLPFIVKIGAGYNLDKLKIGTDLDIVERNLKLHFGTEYKVRKHISIRVGYEQIDDLNLLKGLSLGFGYETEYSELISFKSESIFVGVFNYSFTYLGEELGFAHRISLGSKF
ncbi:MAG: PorV/PorQ family protein [Endomicrobiia bacterium]